MSVLSVAPISYENSITKKELPLNIFQGKFPIAIKREVSIRIYIFTQTPYVTGQLTVGGLQAPEIATALTSQIVGLVPLVLGLLVLAIGLWKGLKHLRQTLNRA